MSKEDQIKKLEDLGYEVLMGTISKIDSQQNEVHIGNITKQGEVIIRYLHNNIERLEYSIELKRTCKENNRKYSENREELSKLINYIEKELFEN